MVQRYETLSRRTIRLSPNTYSPSIALTTSAPEPTPLATAGYHKTVHQAKPASWQ